VGGSRPPPAILNIVIRINHKSHSWSNNILATFFASSRIQFTGDIQNPACNLWVSKGGHQENSKNLHLSYGKHSLIYHPLKFWNLTQKNDAPIELEGLLEHGAYSFIGDDTFCDLTEFPNALWDVYDPFKQSFIGISTFSQQQIYGIRIFGFMFATGPLNQCTPPYIRK
jgi:hypothetical protein